MSDVKRSGLLVLGIVCLLPVAGRADDEHTPDDASAAVQKPPRGTAARPLIARRPQRSTICCRRPGLHRRRLEAGR